MGLTLLLRKAGVTPWPSLFHNLRASRQTELAAQFPSHVVCARIGNGEHIAAAHYLQVTEAHSEKAISGGAKVSAARSGAVDGEALQKKVRSASDRERQGLTQPTAASEATHILSLLVISFQRVKATRPGFEPGLREPKSLVLPLHYRVVVRLFWLPEPKNCS
jgi:hypothetical protein